MSNHLEVPFQINEISKNATVQLDRNGAYVTLEGLPTAFIERRYVQELFKKWDEVPR